MLTFVLACSLLLQAGEDPRLAPGQRLEGVDGAWLEIAEAGTYTLARSDGALILDGERNDAGWLIAELAPGAHMLELPDGPGDVTALAGSVELASAADFLNRGIRHLDAAELPDARTALLACRARPGLSMHHGMARMMMGSLVFREGGDLQQARNLLIGSREAVVASGQLTLLASLEDYLGQVALALGDWNDAQQCFDRERAAAVDAGVKALATSRMAQAAAGRRDHDGARRLHEEALAALDEHCQAYYATAVRFEAGRWYQSRADFARAAQLLQLAAAGATVWTQQVEALGQLALVELLRGHYGTALGLMDRTQALAAPHMPSAYDSTLLQARSTLAFSLGEFGAARECVEQLLASVKSADERSTLLTNLALLSELQDDGDRAMQLYDESLSAAAETSRARWLALNGKAALLLDRELTPQAAPLSVEALSLAERLDDPYLRAVSLMTASEVNCRLGSLDTARSQADASVAGLMAQDAGDLLLPALHGVARAALLAGDEAKVAELLDRAWKESAREEISALSSLEAAQVRSRRSERNDWGSVAADLAARRAGHDPASVAEGLRRVAQWKSHTLLAALDGAAGAPSGVPTDLVPRLTSLLGDSALVEYVAGDARLYAFVLQGAELRLVDLGARRPIEELVQAYADDIGNEKGSLPDASEVIGLGRQLHQRLLAPLGLARDSVVIVPDGELARLPFEALVVSAPEGATRFDQIDFVLDRMDVSYAPSSAALVALAAPRSATLARGALLLGDPTYAAEVSPVLLAARGDTVTRWPRVPKTRDELARIARLLLTQRHDERVKDDLYELSQLETTRDVSLSTQSFELRLGREASVSALASLAPSARLIHIAAHAHIDRWDAHRSGLVLAWDAAGQGLFSLADIAGLKLDADLVVLSACRTADGPLLNGEGVQSMANAFLTAGARGVIATLWKVQDAEAEALMESFTTAFVVEGASPGRALRHAKQALRAGTASRGEPLTAERPDQEFGNPYYWAAFVYSGAAPEGEHHEAGR